MIFVRKFAVIVLAITASMLAGRLSDGAVSHADNKAATPLRTTTVALSTAVPASRLSAGTTPVATSDLEVIDFLDRSTGVALTDSAFASSSPPMRLAVTSDGGEHWWTEGIAIPEHFWGGSGSDATLAFVSSRVGFVDNGTALIGTTDGGLHWTAVRLGDQVVGISLVGSNLWAAVIGCPISAAVTPHCPVAVDSAAISPHGTRAWRVHRLSIEAIPGAQPVLARPSESVGLLTGLLWPDDNKNLVLVTQDGGSTWQTAGAPCAAGEWVGAGQITAVVSTPGRSSWWLLCIGGGGAGTITKGIEWSGDFGRTWSQIAAFASISPYRNRGNLPAGDAGPLVATSRSRLWLATANYLSSSSDGGRTWRTPAGLDLRGGGELARFSFIDSSHGWLVVPGVGLWRTVNGSYWTALKS